MPVVVSRLTGDGLPFTAFVIAVQARVTLTGCGTPELSNW